MGFLINKNSIVYSFNLCGTRFRIYTGLTTEFWDSKAQRVAKLENFSWEKNAKLEKYERLLADLKNRIRREGWAPDPIFIHAAFEHITEKKVEASPEAVVFIYQLIRKFKTVKAATLAPSHLKNFKSLADYFESHHRMMQFTELNQEFYHSYVTNLIEQEGLLHNTIVRKVRELRTVAAYARRIGVAVHREFDLYKMREIRYQPFYLDWDTHVQALEKIALSTRNDRIRDRFLFRCYTGMREGEMAQLIPQNFTKQPGKVYLKYLDIKGKKNKSIQLHPKAIAIAVKYSYDLPKCSQQEENRIIKEVAELAGLNQIFQRVRHSGNKVKANLFAYHKIISSHTARRTFARRWYENGGDLLKLSKYLGHSSIRTTEMYVGVEQDDVNDEMIRVIG
jgi:site-specific recombinase XerD